MPPINNYWLTAHVKRIDLETKSIVWRRATLFAFVADNITAQQENAPLYCCG